MKPLHWRGTDFFNPEKPHPNILIIGCGHIGSYAAFAFARMGVKKITVVDHDMVEPHNLPNQFFAESIVKDLPDTPTLYKVIALQQTLKYLMPSANIDVIPLKIEAANINFSDYACVLVAVDDMDIRKWIWRQVMGAHGVKLLLDARTGGAFANTFGIELRNRLAQKIYEENLYDNSEAAPLPCTGTAIIDVSFAVVADLVLKYRQFAADKFVKVIHAFHDGVIGTTSIMRADAIPSSLKRTPNTVGIRDGDNVKEPPTEAIDG